MYSTARDQRTAALESFESIRQQESVFILLNLAILATLIFAHVTYEPLLARPPVQVLSLFAGRFLWQALELVWLHTRVRPFSRLVTRIYAIATVLLHLTFASVASLLSDMENSHYVILFVLPTIAVAFRFGWLGTAATVLLASGCTLLEVRMYYSDATAPGRSAEYFEATTVIVVYAAVGAFVHLVARQLRAEQRSLEQSLLDLAEARDRIIEQEKLAAVGRLSAAMAHEICNPVTLISSAVATTKRCGFAPEVLAEMCQIVDNESQRLARLSEEFLLYARQAAPQHTANSVRTSLEYVAGLTRPKAAENGAHLQVILNGDFEANFDAFQVHQALLNLSVNAVEAAGSGGKATLWAEPLPGAGVRFLISNTGPAISPEQVQHVFEPFYTTKPRGTGLGLSIALKITQAHGGSLRLDFNEPNQVRFELRLPGDNPPVKAT